MTAEQYSGTPADVPTKQRVEVSQPSGDVVVVNTKEGEVNWVDKLKGYWHTIITVIGAILVVLNELLPLTASFGPTVQHAVTAVILILTAVVNASKHNEVWVNQPGTAPATE